MTWDLGGDSCFNRRVELFGWNGSHRWWWMQRYAYVVLRKGDWVFGVKTLSHFLSFPVLPNPLQINKKKIKKITVQGRTKSHGRKGKGKLEYNEQKLWLEWVMMFNHGTWYPVACGSWFLAGTVAWDYSQAPGACEQVGTVQALLVSPSGSHRISWIRDNSGWYSFY